MHRLFILLGVLTLSGCGWEGVLPDSPDQGQRELASAQQMHACMTQAARDLDDGKSDATTIAYAVVSRCSSQIDAALRVHADTFVPGGYPAYMTAGRQAALGVATQTVLKVRRGQ